MKVYRLINDAEVVLITSDARKVVERIIADNDKATKYDSRNVWDIWEEEIQ